VVTGLVPGPATRSGFVALAGRPNAGKSTLVNAIVGHKIAIVSDKPQTTRRAIRGIANGPDWQLVLVDLPGVQRPRDSLTERMQRRVERELGDSDAALVVLNGQQGVGGPGDRFIAAALAASPVPVIAAVNKIDRLSHGALVKQLQAASDLLPGSEVFPISARRGTGVARLTEHLVSRLPTGPRYYPIEDRTDLSDTVLLAELVREQVLRRTREEIPHAVEVAISEIEHPRDGLTIVRGHVWVETESQKGIVIGSGGKLIREIGTAARRSLEDELETKVHLELSVRVRRRWRADDGLLDRLGID
jgi:GTP-binding protein Era